MHKVYTEVNGVPLRSYSFNHKASARTAFSKIVKFYIDSGATPDKRGENETRFTKWDGFDTHDVRIQIKEIE